MASPEVLADCTGIPNSVPEGFGFGSGETIAHTSFARPRQFQHTFNFMSQTYNGFSAPSCGEIALCAYLIWEKEGRPLGRESEHWLQAEAQLLACRAHEGWTGHRFEPLDSELVAAQPADEEQAA